jgi:Helicase HerA, central domain
MEIERLARKLKPLMPQEIQQWLRIRDTADADLKSLIDKQIVSLAHERLGDYRNKILLSLPPRHIANGTIRLGTVQYEKEKWSAGISESELLQNMAIFGRSGAGKTNVAFHLLEQLVEKGIPFLFLDWKRTARHILPRLKQKVDVYTPGRSLSPFPFNPFIVPPGLEPRAYINHLIDALADAYTLGDGARRILEKAISACYQQGNVAPTVNDVLSEVNKIPEKERVRSWKITALRALESLAFSEVTAKDRAAQEVFARSILNQNTIIELDALAQGGKKFIVPLLCLWLYYVKLSSPDREKLRFVIFVEEAHHMLYRNEQRSKESLMNMLLRQCREIGVSMIVVDQHPHLISSAALGNTYTSICMNQKNPSDINKAAGISLVENCEKRYFSQLPVGQGIVKLQDRWRKPFLVQFPLIPVKKGVISDNLLKRYSAAQNACSGRKNLKKHIFGQVRQVHLNDYILDKDAFALLYDVLQHKTDGVKQRYRRLNMSIGKGNRIKQELINNGLLECQTIPLGNTRKLLLRLTKQARDTLKINQNLPERASIAHEYWKHHYAQLFKEQGYQVTVEASRHGGQTDILAKRNNKQIAVEIETGKSNAVSNVKNNLLARIDRIIVIATDKQALIKTENQLAKANLLIPNRVEMHIAGKYDFAA